MHRCGSFCRKAIVFFLISCWLCAGCQSSSYLQCRTEFLTPAFLASEQIDTPDPLRISFYGQQLVVRWHIPRRYVPCNPYVLLKLHYANQEREIRSFCITAAEGFWVYPLIEEAYWAQGGVVAFQAQLFVNQTLIDTWTHTLWVEPIELGD